MCGIIGAVSYRNIVPDIVRGMRMMEYRGYDSSGIAVINSDGDLARTRCAGRVEKLSNKLKNGSLLSGTIAIGHTRWATHGLATDNNAHPLAIDGQHAIVCNGIIENYEELKQSHIRDGKVYESETDTEVILHELSPLLADGMSMIEGVQETTKVLTGSFAFAILSITEPHKMVIAKRGSPLLIGLGEQEIFVASDAITLSKFANSIVVMENGDIAEISDASITKMIDEFGNSVDRRGEAVLVRPETVTLGPYSHYMQKEIFEQSSAVSNTLENRISNDELLEEEAFGAQATKIFDEVEAVRILACGTSYHAGMVAKLWLESFGIPCEAEIASEFRYRKPVVPQNALVVALSQSGETADTLAALEQAKRLGFKHSLAICNSPLSSLTRITDLVFHTRAGPEISVASTKAFTTQIASLLLLMIALARRKKLSHEQEKSVVTELRALPARIDAVLQMEKRIQRLAGNFVDKEHTLFLGRGTHYPIALEGALKLKEISYIHADAYPAGELKHGPLALIDSKMPTIAVAPNNHLLAKLKANIQEVRARGGRLFVFSDSGTPIAGDDLIEVIEMVQSGPFTSPVLHTIALQLLAYHVAIIKGTDVDNPRNLAKSVTVE